MCHGLYIEIKKTRTLVKYYMNHTYVLHIIIIFNDCINMIFYGTYYTNRKYLRARRMIRIYFKNNISIMS